MEHEAHFLFTFPDEQHTHDKLRQFEELQGFFLPFLLQLSQAFGLLFGQALFLSQQALALLLLPSTLPLC